MNVAARRAAAALILGLVLGLPAPAAAGRMVTEVISIGYRNADEVVAMLRPLVPPPGTVTHLANQLVVKTTLENMREIRRLLESIDRAPANLLIQVRSVADAEVRRDLAQAPAAIEGGDVRASAGSTGGSRRGLSASAESGGVSAKARVLENESRGDTRSSQQVRVLEGKTAFIAAGEARPSKQRTTVVQNGRVIVRESTDFTRAESGFYVRPRLTGERVILDIFPADNRFDGRRIETREVRTSVSGRLGRWMEIGGVSESSSRSSSGIGSSESRASKSGYSVYVRVTKIE